MMKKYLVPLIAATFMASTLGILAGCNTMEGAGKDVEQGGKAIKNEAKETKDKM